MIYLIINAINDGLTTGQIIAFIIGYIFALIIGFGLHEFSHAFVATKLGDPTPKALGRLTINPFKHLDLLGLIGFFVVGFGWAKPVQINPLNFKNYQKGLFLVSISGVVTNLILAFIFSGAYFFFVRGFGQFDMSGALTYSNSLLYLFSNFFLYSIILNLAMFVFNLLPVFPLDGFNMVKSFTKTNNAFVDFMYKYGAIIMLIIIVTPFFDVIYSNVTGFIADTFFKFWRLFV